MKKIISMLLIFALTFNLLFATSSTILTSQTTPDETVVFKDMVSKSHWSYPALVSAVDSGIMNGASNKIRPYDQVTRAEMVAMIINASGLGSIGQNAQDMKSFQGDLSGYTDVAATDWFYNQISMAKKIKLIEGVSKTEIAPNQAVTREQVFTILSNFMSLNTTDVDAATLSKFTDNAAVSSWAKPNVGAMVKAGYVTGSGGYLKPSDGITRQEFAQLMHNLFQSNYIKDKASATALNHKTIKSNVIVSAPEVTLSNVNVTGDLIIADGVGNGNVTLDHVTIAGRLIVRGGGEHSIYLKEASAKNIIINKLSDGGVRLHADDGSKVTYVEIQDGKDTVIIDCKVENLTISDDNLAVVVNQAVENIKLSGDNVHLSGTGRIATITLEKGVNKLALDSVNAKVVNLSGNTVNVVNKEGKSTPLPSTSTIAEINNIEKDKPNSIEKDEPTPPVRRTQYTVNLHANGGTAPNTVLVNKGATLGELPVPQKENAIFIGWYTDSGLTENAVSKDTRVTSNMDVYASYITSAEMPQSNVQTVASVMDVATNYSITILSTNTNMSAADVKAAITLETKTEDATEFKGISVTGSGGTYSVTGIDGFSAGCSYSITLNSDVLSFQGERASVSTFNLSVIAAAPVLNLELNKTVKFIPVAQISAVTQNGMKVESISAPLYKMNEEMPINNLNGTFIYNGIEKLSIGNVIAIYKGVAPDMRVANVDYSDQPISYVTITGINGTTISYGDSDPSDIIFTPDVLPVNTSDDLDGSANNSALTIDKSKMAYSGAYFAEMGLDSETTVDTGDFIAFYTGALADATTPTYGKITGVTLSGTYYVIQYTEVTQDAIFSSMDMASSSDLSYEQIENNVGVEEMQHEIQKQVVESGFSESASEFLIALAELDDETREKVTKDLGIQNFSIDKRAGAPITTLGSGPNVTVKAKVSKDLEHFDGKGLRCEVTITTEIEIGDDMSLTISGTFVEEIKVKLNIDSKAYIKWKGIIPYVDEYKVSAAIDIYNYTYLGLDMVLKSESNEGWSDEFNVTDTIEDLQNKTSKIEANDQVREFYELYQKMMDEEHDYFELFNVNIGDFTGTIDPLNILAYGFSIDFVVSLDANVALGSEFSYEKGTRYSFTIKVFDKKTSSKETVLLDEQYNFNVYAMGELGVRAGIKLTLKVGLFSVKVNSVGISVEVGAYWKIWGFVSYRLNHVNDVTTTKSNGACYMEVGIYLTTAFNAQVGNGKIEYNKELSSDTWPLWHGGSQYYIYDFNYTLNSNNDDIFFKGNQPTYTLPTSVFKMSQMDFKTGDVSTETQSANDFKYTIKDDINKAFTVSKSGVITVTPPKNSDIAKASIEVAWNKAPLSFTSVPIARTFELTWDNLANSYVINFESNQGSNVANLKGSYDSSIVLPVPTREGYIFGGWYTDNSTFVNPFTSTKMPATNTKLFAKWTAGNAKYLVRHYQAAIDGGAAVLTNTETFTAATGTNVTPIVKNYPGFISPAARTVAVAGDGSTVIEYYYDRNAYTLTFILGNGSADMVSTLKYGLEIAKPSLFRNGYIFTGWNTEVAKTMPAQSMAYTAQWSLENYTITYGLEGGIVGGNPATYNINSNTITIANPTKAGFTFDGWTGSGLLSPAKTLIIPSGSVGNRYYTATWKPSDDTKYFVYHKKEDASGNYSILEIETLKGTAGNNTVAQSKVYLGFTAEAFTQQPILANETTTIEIKYTRNSHLLTFNANGGVGGSSTNVKYDATITAPVVTRTGYTFSGWDAPVVAKMLNNALTYTAQWLLVNYSITYGLDGGSMGSNPNTYSIASNDLTIVNPTKTGFIFMGWLGTGLSIPTKNLIIPSGSMGNRQYTATWKSVDDTNYSVIHKREDLSGNYTILEVETLKGTAGSTTAAQSKAYTGFTVEAFVQQPILANETTAIEIRYARNSYLLTFNANGGDGGTAANVKYDATITAPVVTRTGYTFSGWDQSVAQKMPTGALTYTAQWTPNTYNVVFSKNAADATGSMNDQSFTYGVDQTLTVNGYSRTGYTFAGWNTALDGTGTAYTNSQMVSNLTAVNQASVVLYAQWTAKTTTGIFEAKYSAKYQAFDFIVFSSSIAGNAFDASSSRYQFDDVMLTGRYFELKKTNNVTKYALYMYESDGTPVVKGVSPNLHSQSKIGLLTNDNLTNFAGIGPSLNTPYDTESVKGLVAIGTIDSLWDQGLLFFSSTGYGYFISGKVAYSTTGTITLTNKITNPTITQLNAVTDFKVGPLLP